MSTSEVLAFQAAVTSAVLCAWWKPLQRRDLFTWRNAGFWSWLALALYFVAAPLSNLIARDTSMYDLPLAVAGGAGRGLWIALVSNIGISIFFFAYLRTREPAIRGRLRVNNDTVAITRPMWIVLALCCIVGLYSLVKYRSGWVSTSGLVVSNGRFVGQTTGYEYSAHMLLFVPVTLLLLSSRRLRVVGFLLGLVYVGVSALDPWGRYLVVSMILAMLLSDVAAHGPRWRRVALLGVALVAGVLLQARGHTQWQSGAEAANLLQSIPSSLPHVLGGADVSMLGGWYLQSYVNDTLVGYDYGIPLVNYALLGPVPSRIFPDKYFMIDWLHSQQPTVTNQFITTRLYGAKSSLLGSFYGHGGIYAVVLLMAITGFLARKLDGLLRPDAPTLVQATGFALMSTLWMDWGSDDFWILSNLGLLAIPAVALWIVAEKERPERWKRPATVTVGASKFASGRYVSDAPKIGSQRTARDARTVSQRLGTGKGRTG